MQKPHRVGLAIADANENLVLTGLSVSAIRCRGPLASRRRGHRRIVSPSARGPPLALSIFQSNLVQPQARSRRIDAVDARLGETAGRLFEAPATASSGRYRTLSGPMAAAILRSISGVSVCPSMNHGAKSSETVDMSMP